MALFRRKIALYRFNQGAHTIAGGLKWERGAEPPSPELPLTLTTDNDRSSSAYTTLSNANSTPLATSNHSTNSHHNQSAQSDGLSWPPISVHTTSTSSSDRRRRRQQTLKQSIRHSECNKLCAWRHNICPRPSVLPVGAQAPRAPPSRRNVAVLSYAEYVPTLTAAAALRVKAALSKRRPWSLTFWPWKWCPNHVWRGLPLCQFWSSYRPLGSRLRPDVRDRQTDVRQKHRSIPRRGGGI